MRGSKGPRGKKNGEAIPPCERRGVKIKGGGDHSKWPHTISSEKNAEAVMGVTLFYRTLGKRGAVSEKKAHQTK